MDGSLQAATGSKDPRTTARKYQLDLCQMAVKENTIVYLGTGCGKTHIAVLLMYELGHLIRKPSREVCVFLAPTVLLVQQQATVIQSSTDFKVRSYFGRRNQLKDRDKWDKEMEQYEVLVMTPQILLQNLQHCFIRMDLITLLIFDECHHAQVQSQHPYAQIMKLCKPNDTNVTKCPHIFGMTASPSIGKGGSNQLEYSRCINSLEKLLHAKVHTVDDQTELESIVASPEIKVYFYGPVVYAPSSVILASCKKLELLKQQLMPIVKEKVRDIKDRKNMMKNIWKMHDSLIFCLENIGLCGAIQAVQLLLSSERFDMVEMEMDGSNGYTSLADQYLHKAASDLTYTLNDDVGSSSFISETLEEPFFSKKLSVLIGILSTCRHKPNIKCIIFVKRIIIARALANLLGSLKILEFWKCEFLVGLHSGLKSMSRKKMNSVIEKFSSGEVNLLVATNVAEEGLDIQTCCLVVRFDLPETVSSFIQSRGRARMLKSEYVFLVERGNQHDEKLLNDFIYGEEVMNKEILFRTSDDSFDDSEEEFYKVNSTGASVNVASSVQLLYHYCSKLPRDIYYNPSPKFFYMDDLDGTVCRIILPTNSALRQVDSLPCPSKIEARRAACLKACSELHVRGALTDYLLPNVSDGNKKQSTDSALKSCDYDSNEDDGLREELHEMLVPDALKSQWTNSLDTTNMYFYNIRFVPIPDDRLYRMFGLFIKDPLPKEAENLEVDLHLARGRIVKAGLVPTGTITFDREEIILAQNYQEMFLKIILDRSEFLSDHVPLGNDVDQYNSSTFYLLLPVKQKNHGDNMVIDWPTIKWSLSSQVFGRQINFHEKFIDPMDDVLVLSNGTFNKHEVVGSLVFTQHNKLFFFIDEVFHGKNGSSPCKDTKVVTTYAEHYKERFGVQLSRPEQPFLKAKQLYFMRNLLHNRVQEHTEARCMDEHFVELPPELCSLKIEGFSKDIGSSLSLLPSLMHRLENLLVAIELKNVLSASFAEGSEIRADCILEALTTEKCLERISLERFEVLGDAFLKYAVGRHCFLSYEGLDEGQLTRKRSNLVNNFHLYDLAIKKNLQMYIHDELFDPAQFYALGRPCKVVCNGDTSTVHGQRGTSDMEDGAVSSTFKCTKSHQWLHRKTIADVVEALVGAFLVECGFKAAIAFLRWFGIHVDFDVTDLYKVCIESKNNLSLVQNIDVEELEGLLGYKFKHKGLLLQAFVHPSYSKHSGGCYQKLEFLGDAVLEYLITSYVYSAYPDLKPGQITDLRSITVNNNSFARIAVVRSFHKYLVRDSDGLTEAINKFERFVLLADSEVDLLVEPPCPKVLGDIVESCIGALLIDTGFNLKQMWHLVLTILEPVLCSSFQLNPVREIRELCQSYGLVLELPDPVKDHGVYSVKVVVAIKSEYFTFNATNHNSKIARRMAAQEALCKLKALGFKHKSKSLEEIMHITRKKEPELIGFDEDSIVFEETYDELSISMENLRVQESKGTPLKFSPQRDEVPSSSRHKALHNGRSDAPESVRIPVIVTSKDKKGPMSVQQGWTNAAAANDKKEVTGHQGPLSVQQEQTYASPANQNHKETIGAIKLAKSQLYEICTANYWKPPSFVCCKEEGLSHLKKFTYKVSVEVEGTTPSVVECYSEPKSQKKAAQENAAEGLLWCLKHLGHLPAL